MRLTFRKPGSAEPSAGRVEAKDPRKHRRAQYLVLFLVSAAAVAMLFILTRPEPAPVSTSATLDGIELRFGLNREALTRSLRLDLCASDKQSEFAECAGELAPAATADDRPAIVSAVVESDLQQVDGQGTFPAGQLLVSASNTGRTAVLLNVNANPSSPEDVPAGVYLGTVVVERSEGPVIQFRIEADLSPRTGTVTGKVLAALAIGAFGGTMLKWIDDSFSPLAALRRRQRRVELQLDRYRGVLPQGVLTRLEDVRFAISTLDAEGVASSLDEITANQNALVRFCSGVERLEREVWAQEQLGNKSALPPSATAAIEVEKQFVADLRVGMWPWERADEVDKTLKRAQSGFQMFTRALRHWVATKSPIAEAHVERLAGEIIDRGPEHVKDEQPQDAVSRPPEASVGSLFQVEIDEFQPRSAGDVPRREPTMWLLDNAWWITLGIIATTVVAFGFQSQFLENSAFEGDRLDYFALATWAFAVQVAGGTVIETVGRLRTGTRP